MSQWMYQSLRAVRNSRGQQGIRPRIDPSSKPDGFAWESDRTQHIFVRGTDNNIHEAWFTEDTTGWQWHNLSVVAGATVQSKGAPSACIFNPGTEGEYVFYPGVDGNIYQFDFNRQRGNWDWVSDPINSVAGAPQSAGNPVAIVQDDTLHLIYLGQQGSEIQIVNLYTSDGQQWSHNIAACDGSPAPAADTGLAGGVYSNELHIIYAATDNNLYDLYTTDNNNIWQCTGNPINAASVMPDDTPATYTWTNMTLNVIYRGGQNGIYQSTYNGNWTQNADSINPSDFPAASAPAACCWKKGGAAGTAQVAYLGQQTPGQRKIIINLHSTDNTNWNSEQIDANGSRPPIGGPIIYPWEDGRPFEGTLHIIYPGSDNALHELWQPKPGA